MNSAGQNSAGQAGQKLEKCHCLKVQTRGTNSFFFFFFTWTEMRMGGWHCPAEHVVSLGRFLLQWWSLAGSVF